MGDKRRDGFDVAYLAVAMLGLVLTGLVLAVAMQHATRGDTEPAIDENLQLVLVAGLGGIATVAGAALGYQVGSRAPRRSTDPGADSVPDQRRPRDT